MRSLREEMVTFVSESDRILSARGTTGARDLPTFWPFHRSGGIPMSRHTLSVAFATSFLVASPCAVAQSTVAPGDDFFAYANADWLQANEIPAGKQRWSVRNESTRSPCSA
jgi:hypothetical protein